MKIRMSLNPYEWEKGNYPLGIPIVIVQKSTGSDKKSIWDACESILKSAESYKDKSGAANYIIPSYDGLHRTDTYFYKEQPFLVWHDIEGIWVGARILFEEQDEIRESNGKSYVLRHIISEEKW